ncbi:UNVERIFIED_CONTAM: hypothetical protein C7454_12253 [Acidovorax defluvii]
MTITKEQRERFLSDYRSRIIERAGWTPEEAKAAADAIDDVDELIKDGCDGITAADEEMSCWTNDE